MASPAPFTMQPTAAIQLDVVQPEARSVHFERIFLVRNRATPGHDPCAGYRALSSKLILASSAKTLLVGLVRMKGLISASVASTASYALRQRHASPAAAAHSWHNAGIADAERQLARLDTRLSPKPGSMVFLQNLLRRLRGHFLDVHAARGRLAISTGLPCARSSTMPRYSSRSIGSVCFNEHAACTTRPSGPV